MSDHTVTVLAGEFCPVDDCDHLGLTHQHDADAYAAAIEAQR